MPATFKPELKTAPRQDGTCAIRIRITKFRKHAYWNVGKYVLPSNWNPKPKPHLFNWVVKHEDAPQINNVIKNTLKGLEGISDTMPAATAVQIKEAYEAHLNPQPEPPRSEQGFFAFFAEYIARTMAINPGTGQGYAAARNCFLAFTGPGLEDEQIISPDMLHRYRVHLSKKLQPSTLKLRFDVIGHIYRHGVLEGRVKQLGDPFKSIRIIVPEKIQPRPTEEHIRQLLRHSPTKPNQKRARLAALLQYCLHGARISEALTLEWDKHVFPDKVVFLPSKRARKLKTIPRGPLLNWLLEQMPRDTRYVLPFLRDKDNDLPPLAMLKVIQKHIYKINYALQQIDVALGFNIKLSSHMMRRAFLDKVIDETSDLLAAQSLAGHSSSKTTEGYLKGQDAEKLKKLSSAVYEGLGIPGGEPEENNLCKTVTASGLIKLVRTAKIR